MNSYNISYKKGPPSVYPSLIPYNVDKNTRNNVPRLIHVEKRPPCEASIVKSSTLRSSKQQDKFYIEWEKQQARKLFNKVFLAGFNYRMTFIMFALLVLVLVPNMGMVLRNS